jgi:hypothetical protein
VTLAVKTDTPPIAVAIQTELPIGVVTSTTDARTRTSTPADRHSVRPNHQLPRTRPGAMARSREEKQATSIAEE